ncbi:MAG: GxxExxY protein [Kiritimatiellia bacterium]|nr:GxxExxY protein [Kiritimatiellia bacterium]
MNLNEISAAVINAAIKVHTELGPGLFESVYQRCMEIELKKADIKVEAEKPVEIVYDGQKITEEGFRLDLLVEDQLIVELKSVDEVCDMHKKQLLTYLKLARKPLGLLINFNVKLLKEGLTRIAN